MTPTMSPVSAVPPSPVAVRTGPSSAAPAPGADDDGPTHLMILPWVDPVVDEVGHDPRSPYVERFWLATLGPSTTWLLRRLVTGLDDEPDGFRLDLAATARALGLGRRRGRNSPFARAVERSRQFGFARDVGVDVMAVRRRLPPLSRHQVARLPQDLQHAHHAWQEGALAHPAAQEQRRRARHLALSLFELGEDRESVERQLHRWHLHPALAADATRWAWDRHRVAEAAARRVDARAGSPG